MKRAMIAGVALTAVLVLFALVGGYRALNQDLDPASATSPERDPAVADEAHQSFLYGRITTVDGATYEGRLRWGGVEEAFWGNYFNGAKPQNPWVAHVPPERIPKERRPIEIFGIRFGHREQPINLGRLFMARFGDLARIETSGRDVRVIFKSEAVVDLDRFSASDFDDGVRVWDRKQGVVDLDSLRIRAIQLLPAPPRGDAPDRLYGTLRTPKGEFTGFLQWDREECIGSDELNGRTAEGELRLTFDTIRSIARRSSDSALVTLLDGREIVLSGTREVGDGNRGVYVDDPRYGRVLVSWETFEAVEFSPGGIGPAYGDFPAGGPITGTVTTRAGRRLTGRLVYDLDESDVTETLDAPSHGVYYTIPFGLIASILLPGPEESGAQVARVILHSGEELQLERTGDLGDGNAGMLIFVDGRERPEYLRWTDVKQVDLDRPGAMYPPLAAR